MIRPLSRAEDLEKYRNWVDILSVEDKQSPPYMTGFAVSRKSVEVALRLRYRIFNVELEEGLTGKFLRNRPRRGSPRPTDDSVDSPRKEIPASGGNLSSADHAAGTGFAERFLLRTRIRSGADATLFPDRNRMRKGLPFRRSSQHESPDSFVARDRQFHEPVPAEIPLRLLLPEHHPPGGRLAGLFLFEAERPPSSRTPALCHPGISLPEIRTATRQRSARLLCSSQAFEVTRFHPSLLQAAVDGGHPVLPVALKWSITGPGISVSKDVAYWKDHHFPAHVWRVLGLTGIGVEIRFGVPFRPDGLDRRALGKEVHRRVVELFRA